MDFLLNSKLFGLLLYSLYLHCGHSPPLTFLQSGLINPFIFIKKKHRVIPKEGFYALKKRCGMSSEGCAAHPFRYNRQQQIKMAIWCTCFWIWTCWVWFRSPLQAIIAVSRTSNLKKVRQTAITFCSGMPYPTRSCSSIVRRRQESPLMNKKGLSRLLVQIFNKLDSVVDNHIHERVCTKDKVQNLLWFFNCVKSPERIQETYLRCSHFGFYDLFTLCFWPLRTNREKAWGC